MRILFLLLLLIPLTAVSQELPPVINFDANAYKAGNQNWMITQAQNKNIYVANGTGVLEYTGAEWNLYPMANKTVVRSVKAVGNRIYSGAYMEMGYWEENGFGSLTYTSLLPKFPNGVRDGEQFWNIEIIDETVIFQSFEAIYAYNIDQAEVKEVFSQPSNIIGIFKVDDELYFQVLGDGLYKIDNGQPQLVIEDERIQYSELPLIYKEEGNLQLVTQSGNFYRWDGENLVSIFGDFSEAISDLSIFSALHLNGGSLMIGTVENGIFQVNSSGEIVLHFNQKNGLLNNTVLSLFQDMDQNIWAGLDNGLSVINLNSPFRIFEDSQGSIGSVYTSFQGENYLYLGTNQGLYYRKNGEKDFHLMEDTNGQVWSLQMLDGVLFCGHNRGTYIIEGENARRIVDRAGTWTVKKYKKNPDYYVQGHYNGIGLLKKEEDGSFLALPQLIGFPHSSNSIVTEEDGDIWISNEHRGIFRVRINAPENAIFETENYQFSDVSGITSGLFQFQDSLYYSTLEVIFKYDENENKFVENTRLGEVIEETARISGKIVSEGNEKIWGFSANSIFSVTPALLSNDYKVNSVYLPQDLRNITLGYENISSLGNDTYLLGVANGYLEFQKTERENVQKEVRIDQVYKAALDQQPQPVLLQGEAAFHYKTNNFIFDFSIPEYKKFLVPVYSYRLLGLSEQWSEWNTRHTAAFENLPYGSYEFQVRGKIGEETTGTKSYIFEINRPWYLSNLALISYLVIFLLLLFLVHQAYKRHHNKQIEKNQKELRMRNLEAEQKIIKLQNEQLEKDVKSKNKELAVSTMSLIKKNEFLTSIKQKLQDSENSKEVKLVIDTIDRDINEEDNWNFFKEAFNNADKDFFKKVKQLHPQLTSNDLKLCAYLRLNLSSKEIAPLLNISVKSVEIKRYRLRKKMDLPRETNLTDYILQI
ncbi:triple tyrosine motif-containing protein [Salinimicrobium sp. GXAS 041]|uniref:triple tyrosine motif-containing protein n=1 Tax=Salinimicrobium sp. GXAS 041 TaxID=3400806 RepID=UPI003C7460F3